MADMLFGDLVTVGTPSVPYLGIAMLFLTAAVGFLTLQNLSRRRDGNGGGQSASSDAEGGVM